jgi:hypothetical protein
MLVLLLICFCSFYIGFQQKVLFLLTEIEDHVKNQSTPAVNHSGDVEWLDTKCCSSDEFRGLEGKLADQTQQSKMAS